MPTGAVTSAASVGAGDRLRFLGQLFKETAERFVENDGLRLGASFSYYATFSIFPLLLLAVSGVGFLVGDSDVTRDELLDAIASDPASPVREVIAKTLTAMQASGHARGLSALIGAITLLFGASGAFTELDAALNRIWCVPERPTTGVVGVLRALVLERLASFGIVLGLGLTVFLSLAASSLLGFVAARTTLWPAVLKMAESASSILLLSCAFTLAFHFIPRSRPKMRLVLPGAALTTVLLTALKEVFASYLAHLADYSAYGVAGGVLGLATWIYLTSMLVLLGAQLTRVRAEKIGAVPRCAQLRSGCATTPP